MIPGIPVQLANHYQYNSGSFLDGYSTKLDEIIIFEDEAGIVITYNIKIQYDLSEDLFCVNL